jgi:hypothetical protein
VPRLQAALHDIFSAALRIMRIPGDAAAEVLELISVAGASAIGLD